MRLVCNHCEMAHKFLIQSEIEILRNEDIDHISEELETLEDEATLFNSGSIVDIEAECTKSFELCDDGDFSDEDIVCANFKISEIIFPKDGTQLSRKTHAPTRPLARNIMITNSGGIIYSGNITSIIKALYLFISQPNFGNTG